MEDLKKSVIRKQTGLPSLSVLFLLIAFAILAVQTKSVHAIGTVVDDANTLPLQNSNLTCCTDSGSVVDVTSGTVLGSERDVFIDFINGVPGLTTAQVAAGDPVNYISFSNSASNESIATITYDGNDSDFNTLDPTGLGGVDLTASADGFGISVISNDLAAPLTITVYTNATSYSSETVTIDGAKGYFIPYSDFTIGGGAAAVADFANVGAVVYTIDGTGVPDLDVIIDEIDATDRDFGDLPAAYNMVEIVDNGAYHTRGTIYLGSMFDADTNGVESADAIGDDTTTDDEDGVSPNTPWANGANGGSVSVTVGGGAGCLNGWLDWTRDNDFADADERIIINQYVTVGTQNVTFDVPAGYFTGSGANFDVYSRFRLTRDRDGDTVCSDESELDATNPHLYGAYDGEVEDHKFVLSPTAISLDTFAIGENQSWTVWAALAALMGLATATYLTRRLWLKPALIRQD